MTGRDSAERLTRDALACLETEAPVAFAAVRLSLSRRVVDLEIGTERFAIALEARERQETNIAVSASAVALRDVVAGDADLYDAIESGAIDVVGAAADLASAADAARFFITGMFRCRSREALVRRLERLAKREEREA